MNICDLLRFKFGYNNKMQIEKDELDWQKYFIEEDYSGYTQTIMYKNGCLYRDTLFVDMPNIFQSNSYDIFDYIEGLFSQCSENMAGYIDSVGSGREKPVNSDEGYDELLKIVYNMPLLRGIYYSKDKTSRHRSEITMKDVIWYTEQEGVYNILIKNGRIFLEGVMELLGFADSTFSGEKYRCNQIHLCLDKISEVIDANIHDPWNEHYFLDMVFYHELSHCLFGHKGNGVDQDGVTIINKDQEQHAQTYASIFFRDDIASKHIRAYSKHQPREYQGMNLWWSNGELDCSDIYYNVKKQNLTRRKKSSAKIVRNIPKIVFDPADEDVFKHEILKTRKAIITWYYDDGCQVTSYWDARKLTATSNIVNNIQSKTEWRNWEDNGLISVVAKVIY